MNVTYPCALFLLTPGTWGHYAVEVELQFSDHETNPFCASGVFLKFKPLANYNQGLF